MSEVCYNTTSVTEGLVKVLTFQEKWYFYVLIFVFTYLLYRFLPIVMRCKK